MPEPPADLPISFPFLLTLAHRPLRSRDMFRVSRALDFHELGGGRLVIDVEEVQSTQTMLRATPTRPMTYSEIEEETERLLGDLAGPYGSPPAVQRLDWLVPNPGTHSLDRTTRGRIR